MMSSTHTGANKAYSSQEHDAAASVTDTTITTVTKTTNNKPNGGYERWLLAAKQGKYSRAKQQEQNAAWKEYSKDEPAKYEQDSLAAWNKYVEDARIAYEEQRPAAWARMLRENAINDAMERYLADGRTANQVEAERQQQRMAALERENEAHMFPWRQLCLARWQKPSKYNYGEDLCRF